MASKTFNVRNYGAAGDGVTDDTNAFEATINAALAQTPATIQIPAGTYLITSVIYWQIGSSGSMQNYNVGIQGEGDGSVILHSSSNALFAFANNVSHFSVSDLTIIAQGTKSAVTSAAFNFSYGVTKSKFRSINYEPGTGNPSCFFYCTSTLTNDTIEFTNVQIVSVTGIGIQLGRGSSIFYNGGRIIGSGFGTGSTGIYCAGGLGGVYLNNLDIIAHGTALNITQSNGTSNQQFFLSNVTLDSSSVGLSVADNSYVSWSGVWAVSCDIGINFNPASSNATINLSGGIIANSGGLGGSNKYGFSYNGLGRVQMTGLVVYANVGGGFVMGQAAPVPVLITGCEFYANSGYGNIRALSGLYQTGNVMS